MEDQVIGAVVGLLAALAAWLKGHAEVNAVKKDRDVTKADRDTKIALLEQKCGMLEKRLEDGNDRFDNLDKEIKAMNEKFDGKMEKMSEKLTAVFTGVNTLISMKSRSHTPEDRPL